MVGWCLLLVPLKHREGAARGGVGTGDTISIIQQAITKTNPLPLGLFLRGFLEILALSTNINHIPCPGHLCWQQSSAPEVRSTPSLVTYPLLSQQGRVNFTALSDPLEHRWFSQRAGGVISSHRGALVPPGKGQSRLWGLCSPLGVAGRKAEL